MKTFWQTLISQYGNSPKLQTFIEAINQSFSLESDFELFYDYVWNVETAQGYGLDVLGRIVVAPRTLSAAVAAVFGFYEAGDRVGFGLGPFAEAYNPNTTTFQLSDDAYRVLILAKAAYNITNGSVPAINSILMNILFQNRGNAYVVDGHDMTMTYTFTFALQPYELAIVQSGLLPKPTGVKVLYDFQAN